MTTNLIIGQVALFSGQPIFPQFSAAIANNYKISLRLEGRSRVKNFAKALEVQFADPAWNLGRQRQVGEFKFEDAGSPIKVDIKYKTRDLTTVQLGKNPANIPLANAPPLETLIEREKVPLDWRTRIQIGQQFERFLKIEITAIGDDPDPSIVSFRGKYPILAPIADARKEIDKETQAFLRIVAGRSIDGEALFDDINLANPSVPSGIIGNTPAIKSALSRLGGWWQEFYSQPDGQFSDAWAKESLEYKFSARVGSGQNKLKLSANSYRNGALDWYSVALKSSPQNDLWGGASKNQTFPPTRANFFGQPHDRWFAMEDGDLFYGGVESGTTDLARLMLTQFMVTFNNDWYKVPLPLTYGSVSKIEKLTVTDVFGVKTNVERATTDANNPFDRWDMFALSVGTDPQTAPDSDLFFLAPAMGFREEGKPADEVSFGRDEGANKVFAVLTKVPNGMGNGVDGFEWFVEQKALRLDAEKEDLLTDLKGLLDTLQGVQETKATTPASDTATLQDLTEQEEDLKSQISDLKETIATLGTESNAGQTTELPKYQLSSYVPPNWVPYVPVRHSSDPNDPSMKLRRAEMLSAADDPLVDTNSRILGKAGSAQGLTWINEEAISRAGTKVQITRQRVRWYDGKTYLWIGRQVTVGSGPPSSGLTFDNVLVGDE